MSLIPEKTVPEKTAAESALLSPTHPIKELEQLADRLDTFRRMTGELRWATPEHSAALAPEYVRVRRDVAQLAALALSRLETYYVYEGEDGNGPPTLHEDKPVIAAVAHIRAALESTP